jgi:hypothetical protein
MSDTHEHAGACCGGGDGDCEGSLEMTKAEMDLLLDFAQTPFLPVARRADSRAPIYLESNRYLPEKYEKIITALFQKRLIRLDYDMPLVNFDYAAYKAYPHRGSMALTAAGQHVVELLEIQGAFEA